MPSPDSTTRFRLLYRLTRLVLFAALVAWSFAAEALARSAANGLAFRLRMVYGRGLLEAAFRLFLLIIGFVALQGLARQGEMLDKVTALPRRPTAGREWLSGVALGWAMVVAATLPLVLLGRLHTQVDFGAAQATRAMVALATAGLATLAHEMTFRGYPFRSLTGAVGPTAATILMVAAAGLLAWHGAWFSGAGVLASMLLTLLLSLSWLRTHAIWMAWGVHFSLIASATVLFGLPLVDEGISLTMIRSRVFGPNWLTGGGAGPLNTIFALVVLSGAVVVLYRLTRNYAWSYTHAPIVPAGAVVNVTPPAVHTEMEQAAAPGLVQILATTPTAFSAAPAQLGSTEDRLHR